MTLRQSILALLLLTPCSLLLVSAQENDEVGIWSELGIEKAVTKKWDVGLGLEYRAQNKARFSAGVSTSYKPWKWLKLGIAYNFLYSQRTDKYKKKNNLLEKIAEAGLLEEHLQDPDNLEYYPEKWKVGYNLTPEYWFPRHRFSVEATGSIKPWKWLKISLRERYQITYCKARTVSQYKYRDVYRLDKNEYWIWPEGNPDDPWDPINWADPTLVHTYDVEVNSKENEPEKYWEGESKPAYTDQVLRSRLKLEYDKKRCPFSPFISAEFHNSVRSGDRMLLQKIRTSVGCGYKFRKHNEISLAYTLTFDINEVDDETNEVVRLHDRMHAINIGYKYSF